MPSTSRPNDGGFRRMGCTGRKEVSGYGLDASVAGFWRWVNEDGYAKVARDGFGLDRVGRISTRKQGHEEKADSSPVAVASLCLFLPSWIR